MKSRKKYIRKTRKKYIRKTRKKSVRKTRKKSVRKTRNLRGGYSCTSPCNRWSRRLNMLRHPWCWAEDGTKTNSLGHNWDYCNPNIDPLSKRVKIQDIIAPDKKYLNGLEGEMRGKSGNRILVKVERVDGSEELVSLLPAKLGTTAVKHCDDCLRLKTTSPSWEELDEITDRQKSDLIREHVARQEAQQEMAETGLRTAQGVEEVREALAAKEAQMKSDRERKVTVFDPALGNKPVGLGRPATPRERTGRRGRTKSSLVEWDKGMAADDGQHEETHSGGVKELLGRDWTDRFLATWMPPMATGPEDLVDLRVREVNFEDIVIYAD
jgi:hypothetical protein